MSKETNEVIFEWSGEAMVPLARFHNLVNAEFVVGEKYRMEVQEVHSWLSHKHQFAWLHGAWLSLPEGIASRFKNEEQLRKHALIDGGFCDSKTIVCATKAEAERWFDVLTGDDPYCIVTVKGNVLTRYTAQSQSMRAMGKSDFQRSKEHVLNYVAALLEADPRDVEKAA